MIQQDFTIAKSDWQSLRSNLVMVFTAILLSVGLGISANYFYQLHHETLEKYKSNHALAVQRYQSLKNDLEQMRRDLPQLKRLVQNQPGGLDIRQAWIENLQTQQQALSLLPIHYTITSNQPAAYPAFPDSGWLSIKGYPATFDMKLLHEADLLRLMHTFAPVVGKRILLRACTLIRTQLDPATELVTNPSLDANCHLDLLTLTASID